VLAIVLMPGAFVVSLPDAVTNMIPEAAHGGAAR
jgi:hypothetical protein